MTSLRGDGPTSQPADCCTAPTSPANRAGFPALATDTDAALMNAVARLDDVYARCAIIILRGTGLRIGELLDVELDCLWWRGPDEWSRAYAAWVVIVGMLWSCCRANSAGVRSPWALWGRLVL